MPAKRLLTAALALLLAVSFAAPSGARALSDAGFEYTVAGGAATVTGCTSTCPATLVIPDTLGGLSVTRINTRAFNAKGITSVTIPSSVTSIGQLSFTGNSLTSLTIPNSVTNIDGGAFGDNSLTSVTLGDHVATIDDYAFYNNAIATITIPSSVTSIREFAFAKNSLTSVLFDGDAPTVANDVFSENPGLTDVKVWEGTSGWAAFISGVPVTPQAFNEGGFTYTAPGGDAVVTGCTSTCPINLVIPLTLGGYNVRSIGSAAFAYKHLASVEIPYSVQHIGAGAFYMNHLGSVKLPYSLLTIGTNAFAYNALTSVVIPYLVTTIGSGAFDTNALASVRFYPNNLAVIGNGAFNENALTAVVIPNSVTSIGNYAFSFNVITTLKLGSSVSSIGGDAFSYNQISSLVIPATVTAVGDYAFSSNALSSVAFLGNSPTAGNNVFTANTGLTAVSRMNDAIDWSGTWSGVPVTIADARATASVKPTVDGTAKVGKTLTVAKGTWTGYPTPTFTYQWYACTTAVSAARTTVPSTCKKITGATRSTFKLTSAQRGKYVAVLVTGMSLRTTASTWLSKTTTKVK
jgi:hypothetical protein